MQNKFRAEWTKTKCVFYFGRIHLGTIFLTHTVHSSIYNVLTCIYILHKYILYTHVHVCTWICTSSRNCAFLVLTSVFVSVHLRPEATWKDWSANWYFIATLACTTCNNNALLTFTFILKGESLLLGVIPVEEQGPHLVEVVWKDWLTGCNLHAY